MTSTVLVTGSTGYLGFVVLLQTLKAGYHVRAAVRSIEKAKKQLFATPSFSSSNLAEKLSFIEVPDILADGAYDEAVKGVDYIIHVASPVPRGNLIDFEKDLFQPAKAGTLGILKSALAETRIRRIVITSSVVANGFKEGVSRVDAHVRIPTPEGPFTDPFQAYRAGKAAALNSTEEFIAEHKPSWDVVSVQPGYIVGPNELATTTEEFVKGTAFYPIRGYIGESTPTLTGAINVQDTAHVHVAALDKKIPGNRSYGANLTVNWNDAWPVLEKKFPDAVEKGVFTKKELGNVPFIWDASETEEIFGFKFRTLEESTVEVAEAWLKQTSNNQS